MALAGMLAADEGALICDLAETYGILRFRALPARLLATLAAGLRENSRIRMRLAGTKAPQDTVLLAAAVDKLSFLAWAQTKDAQHGRNRPAPVLDILLGGAPVAEGPLAAFDTAEEFETARAEIVGEH